jgi:hypothetical protein
VNYDLNDQVKEAEFGWPQGELAEQWFEADSDDILFLSQRMKFTTTQHKL